MNGNAETAFEVALVVPKKGLQDKDLGHDCIDILVLELQKVGLIVERVAGLSDEFLKLAATLKVLGKAATELQIKKMTYVGVDLQFDWDQIEAFVRQPDGSLFNWCERFRCFHHLIYGILNKESAALTLTFDTKEFMWEVGESLLKKMELEGIVKQVFPLHDETKRKLLLRKWALNWLDFTWQPIDEVYAYFGTKIATYFAFLGMCTRWLFFPAVFALTLQLMDVGSWQLLVPPIFFIFTITWAVLFLQFWKRKNSTLLTRWLTSHPVGLETSDKVADDGVFTCIQSNVKIEKQLGTEEPKDKEYQREEWFEQFLIFRNDAIVFLGITCLQLPFELAYAHIYEVAESDVMRFGSTAVYLLIIQYYTKIGGKISVKLIKNEPNRNTESSANSLVYKVFGLYFMQSYIGLFYHAVVYRDVLSLRRVLIQRLIVSQVLENLLENSIPYLKYSYKKYRAVHKRKGDKGSAGGKTVLLASRVEKEYLKPSYTASTGEELEDGLFDDFLELALQFGLIMMFACAFPLAFAFSLLNNITEIRADALKLLVILRRPIPRAAATIGAWMNIFQFLIVMAICTNCALLVCLYDEEGKWSIEPGLAAILIIEHVLLLIKFGFSHFVPEACLAFSEEICTDFTGESKDYKCLRIKHNDIQVLKQML